MKKVDVILAAYNGESFIKEQIYSILSNFEHLKHFDCRLLISDDQSSDSTTKVVKKISAVDERVILLDSNKKGGVKYNFHYLLNNTNADYIFFSDQDDLWLPEKMKVTLDKILEVENEKDIPVLVHSDLCVVDAQLFPINISMFRYQALNSKPSFSELLISNSVTGCTMACNKILISNIKHSRIQDSIMHDWYMALYASSFGILEFVSKPTILYRQHSNNQVGAKKISLKNTLSLNKLKDNVHQARTSVIRTKKQAELFMDDFGMLLNSDNKKILDNYIQSFNGSFIHRFLFFIKPGNKKKGMLRNFIYFFIFVFNL
ncbi:glycosyl transferase family 2 [Pluralibacter gergoviae]|uniref:glycosyltransferase family 2 protein n=1 Tax=Pluralibacter gergoviae TaxID=61647 RepID=UPI0006501971|nr:glycosyltransferase family 2 protein [Pluralibacter gergoviae]KMK18080.1 glycosyl transferase family 2 [Pluralibacter gergoviae]